MSERIALIWNRETLQADLALDGNGSFVRDGGFRTAVIISFFTDGLANPGDEILGDPTDPRGWWGDTFPEIDGDLIGSRFWLLGRSKTTIPNERLFRLEGRSALQWMIDDGAARAIVVTSDRRENRVGIRVEIHKLERDNDPFVDEWEVEIGGS